MQNFLSRWSVRFSMGQCEADDGEVHHPLLSVPRGSCVRVHVFFCRIVRAKFISTASRSATVAANGDLTIQRQEVSPTCGQRTSFVSHCLSQCRNDVGQRISSWRLVAEFLSYRSSCFNRVFFHGERQEPVCGRQSGLEIHGRPTGHNRRWKEQTARVLVCVCFFL